MTPPNKPKRNKAKFKVGQVVRIVPLERRRGDTFRMVAEVVFVSVVGKYSYGMSDGVTWFTESELCPLTKCERGE